METTPVVGEKSIYELFWWSVLGKGAISFAEVVGGVLAFFIPLTAVTGFFAALARSELAEEPGNFLAAHLLSISQSFPEGSQIFVALYLLSRGLIKLALVVALLRNQPWAYPSSLVVLGLFVLYQLYQIVTTHSILIVLLTLFDLVVMYFIWREYKIIERHVHAA